MSKTRLTANKITLSKETSEKLKILSQRLDMRRNIICRLAIGYSLNIKDSVKSFNPNDSKGFEFNKFTLTGDFDEIYKALVVQHDEKKMDDKEYFSIYLRNHIERGVDALYRKYQKINSPTDFIADLIKL